MQSKILSRRDLDFLLFEWLDVESLTSRQRFEDHSRETFNAALAYTYQTTPKSYMPLAGVKALESPYLKMLRNRLEKVEEQAVASSPLAPRGAGPLPRDRPHRDRGR